MYSAILSSCPTHASVAVAITRYLSPRVGETGGVANLSRTESCHSNCAPSRVAMLSSNSSRIPCTVVETPEPTAVAPRASAPAEPSVVSASSVSVK